MVTSDFAVRIVAGAVTSQPSRVTTAAACTDPGARAQIDDALTAMRPRFDTLRR